MKIVMLMFLRNYITLVFSEQPTFGKKKTTEFQFSMEILGIQN